MHSQVQANKNCLYPNRDIRDTYLQSVSVFLILTVCPDVEMISSPNVFKSCPKSSHSNIYKKVSFFELVKKFNQIFQLLLYDNLPARTFKNRPIWSHCSFMTRGLNLLPQRVTTVPDISQRLLFPISQRPFSRSKWSVEVLST